MKKTWQKILELRNKIPEMHCKPGCFDCCGPHVWHKEEWGRVKTKKYATGMFCPYASKNGCEIYKDRPIICRIYGTTERLRCPHGCRPDKLLSRKEEITILKQYFDLFK